MISDGDLASLVALAHAVEAFGSDRDATLSAGVVVVPARGDRGGTSQRLEPSRQSAIRRQAAFYGAELFADADWGSRDADLLLSAGRLASERGGGRVIWPESAGAPADPEAVDLDRAAALANTALLVERLLEIEGSVSPVIDAPFADLSDRQVADLAIDLGFIPGDVWWAPRADDAQMVAGERWAAAFQAAGVSLRAPTPRRTGSGRG